MAGRFDARIGCVALVVAALERRSPVRSSDQRACASEQSRERSREGTLRLRAGTPSRELTEVDWASFAGVLADRSTRPLALLDRAGRIVLFSASMENLLNWQRYAVQGRSWVETCSVPEQVATTRRWLKQALRGALRHYECAVVTRDGRSLRLLLDMFLIGSGRDQGLVLSVERVTPNEPVAERNNERDYHIVSTPLEFGQVKHAASGCKVQVLEDPKKPCFQLLHGQQTPCNDCPVLRPSTEGWPRTTIRPRHEGEEAFEIITAERVDETLVSVKVRNIPSAVLSGIHRVKIERLSERARLTEREREVLTGLLSAQSTEDMATQLGMTPRTVKFHVGNILQKLGADSRADLIRLVGY